MFRTPVDARFATTSSINGMMAFVGKPLPFPAAMDLCDERVPAGKDCEVLRFAAAARQSASRSAFRAAFTPADWRAFASFCVVRRLVADERVLVPGRADRTLRFVVDGSLWQEGAGNVAKCLLPGTIVGEDGVFSDAPCEVDVRALEDTVVLELSLPRQKEMTAACRAIAFELLRAAGAVIAARGRAAEAQRELAA